MPALLLPAVRPRPAQPGLAGARQHLILSRDVTDGLEALGQREGVTLFMTLWAAFQVVLGRCSSQDDFGIGTPIANRTHAETEELIGFFLNTLVLRADVSGDPTFADLLARVRETTLAAYGRQEVPFERILEALRPSRDPSRTPVFQVFFNLLNFPDERLNRPILMADAPTEDEVAQYELTLYAGENDLSAGSPADRSRSHTRGIARLRARCRGGWRHGRLLRAGWSFTARDAVPRAGALHVDVPLRAIFEKPTVAGLVGTIGALAKTDSRPIAALTALPRG